ncbi:uncharacterized protein LOC124154202 [Ischnura elegans]|uniref:uncharacterized protein LOC124154202 n=1 Tax=Ischnura elegans TaxID=197161 RepID=UPI001ED87DF1|nr:uncharacterized protein LOC124154202 [Ischnura elegans]
MGGAVIWLTLTLLVSRTRLSECAAAMEEPNPLADMARAFLQDSLSGKSEGGQNLGEALIGQIGNMLSNSGGSNSGGGADLLSGIGSMLAASASSGKGSGGGIDPETIGNFVDMLAGAAGGGGGGGGGGSGGLDMESLVGLASSVMAGQQGGGGQGGAGLLNLLPILLQSAGGKDADGRGTRSQRSVGGEAGEEEQQSPWSMLLPPLLATLREQWDNLWKTDGVRKLLKESGLGATLSIFLDSDGRFDSDRVMASLENAPFRRRWVRGAASFVARWTVQAAKPDWRKRIVKTATGAATAFLQSAHVLGEDSFDPTNLPIEETIARVINVGARRFLGIQHLDSGIYIKPAIAYIRNFFEGEISASGKKVQGLGATISAMLDALAKLKPRQVEDRLAEAVNEEIIEPALRVWRAYKFAKRRPGCALYTLCTINRQEEEEDGVSSAQRKRKQAPRVGLKPIVTKVTSLAAGWFLSNTRGTTFWDLYEAIMEDEHICKVKYPGDCNEFHVEDLKATTEYAHVEL